VPVQIRRNCDSIWLFAEMADKMMFSMIMNQVGLNGKKLVGRLFRIKL
jgi:hypothetical protein